MTRIKPLLFLVFVISVLVVLFVSRSEAVSASFGVSLQVQSSGGGGPHENTDEPDNSGGGGGPNDDGDEEPPTPPPAPDSDDGGGGGDEDVFDLLPESPIDSRDVRRITMADFVLLQPGEEPKTFNSDNTVKIDGLKYLSLSLDYALVPEVLKTIGVTIIDPVDPDASFSFLLKSDGSGGAYSATIAPLERPGLYPIRIHLLDYQNRNLKRLNGQLLVSGRLLPTVFTPATGTEAALSLAIGTGVLVGVSSAVFATGASSLYEIYLLLVRGVGALFGLFGYRRKRRPWGTVYDAVTKRPLDPVYVSVIDVNTSKEVASAITDIDGRYSLFLPPGTYRVMASKSHYRFPSQILAGRAEDELYANLYFGGGFAVTGNELTTLNIPLDPIGFDWNEFMKDKNKFFKLFSRRDVFKARLAHWLYGLGFVVAIGSMLITPSLLNVLVILVYGILYAFRFVHRANRRAITVRSAATGQSLPFAVVRVFLPGVEQEIKTIVADAFGRLHLLVRPGTYTLAVDEKSASGGYQRVYQSLPIELARGVLKTDILV